tara:strand:+ start:398 stop:1642 length:1245 start_codon:yes stop_codon:yes gene_type:complete
MKKKHKKKLGKAKKKKISKNRLQSKKLKKLKKRKVVYIKRRLKVKKLKKRKVVSRKRKVKVKGKVVKKPIDRLLAIKIPKLKLKKIKVLKFKFKKKTIYKVKKKAGEITKISFQKVVNFVLAPIFRAYDNYFENKKIKQLEKIAYEQKEKAKQAKEEERSNLENKQRELRNEEKMARERSHDLKRFIRKEQAILRQEQAKKRLRFLEEIKLEKKIESFRKRELEEIKNLEKFALKEQVLDYRTGVEERIEIIKEKYRKIRNQKIRERVESLGVEILDTDTKEDLLQKEKEHAEHRKTIELVLESFYRSANSLVFQLNRKYIPKHKSILRVIDRRYESNECFIRYDDSPDEDWLILIYLEDSDAEKGKIIVENKANPEKHQTKSFETKEIFTYSDYLVDAMTAHIDRERNKKNQI